MNEIKKITLTPNTPIEVRFKSPATSIDFLNYSPDANVPTAHVVWITAGTDDEGVVRIAGDNEHSFLLVEEASYSGDFGHQKNQVVNLMSPLGTTISMVVTY